MPFFLNFSNNIVTKLIKNVFLLMSYVNVQSVQCISGNYNFCALKILSAKQSQSVSKNSLRFMFSNTFSIHFTALPAFLMAWICILAWEEVGRVNYQ